MAEGFQEHRFGPGWLMVDAVFADAAREIGLHDPGVLARGLEGSLGSPASQGRGQTTLIALPGRPERLHLRRVLHGGAIGGLWHGRLAGIGRVRSELHVTAKLRAKGAPVPMPALAIGLRHGLLWEAGLATIHQEDTVDGLALLAKPRDAAEIEAAAMAAGRAVRRFHDLGGAHRDLHIGNLLFAHTPGTHYEDVEVTVIDLDGASARAPASASRRMRELMRLHRSIRKRDLADRLGERGCAAFFDAYCNGERDMKNMLLSARRHRFVR